MPQRAPTQKISPLKTTLTPKPFAKFINYSTQVFLVFCGLNFFHLPFFTPTPWDHQNVSAAKKSSPGPVGGEDPPIFSRFSPPYYNLLTGKKSPPCWNMIHSRKNSYVLEVSIPLGLGFSRRNIPFNVGKIQTIVSVPKKEGCGMLASRNSKQNMKLDDQNSFFASAMP